MSDDYVRPWNPVIADKYAQATERLLLGACGRAWVSGSRVAEAAEREHARIIQEREARAARGRDEH